MKTFIIQSGTVMNTRGRRTHQLSYKAYEWLKEMIGVGRRIRVSTTKPKGLYYRLALMKEHLSVMGEVYRIYNTSVGHRTRVFLCTRELHSVFKKTPRSIYIQVQSSDGWGW
jgi:ABC-type Na+ transport system ATPase subunit NatA